MSIERKRDAVVCGSLAPYVFALFNCGHLDDTVHFSSTERFASPSTETVEVFNLMENQVFYHRPMGGITIVNENHRPMLDMNQYGESKRINEKYFNSAIARGGVIIRVTCSGGEYIYREGDAPISGEIDVADVREGNNTGSVKNHSYYISISQESLETSMTGVFIPRTGMTIGLNRDSLRDKYLMNNGINSNGNYPEAGWRIVVNGNKEEYPNLYFRIFDKVERVAITSSEVESTVKVFRSSGVVQEDLVFESTVEEALRDGIKFAHRGEDFDIPFHKTVKAAKAHLSPREAKLLKALKEEKVINENLKTEAEKAKATAEKYAGKSRGLWSKATSFLLNILPSLWKLLVAIF